jgi:hypothetical protein
MLTNKQETSNAKKNSVTHITILIVVISLIIIAALLATSNFDFMGFLMKLHGG